ncbi:putative Hydroxyacyl-thioester dehydratase type 2 [Blumeria hordei DH14]|uniref:Putative Hydroxyacyl-thioester dehydratase type 2 n=1 Tax=Blumeria graminis f. sp. hordei (strain DH14) TaxID=546991 RepID=N1JHL2_BLUG1|nr:putative Hydroxyacyl-thioester dehydratase type 2 [Blumeria hordei DH14]
MRSWSSIFRRTILRLPRDDTSGLTTRIRHSDEIKLPRLYSRLINQNQVTLTPRSKRFIHVEKLDAAPLPGKDNLSLSNSVCPLELKDQINESPRAKVSGEDPLLLSGVTIKAHNEKSKPFELEETKSSITPTTSIPSKKCTILSSKHDGLSTIVVEGSNTFEKLQKSLREQLLARPAITYFDHMSPTPSNLLRTLLSSYLPFIGKYQDDEIRSKDNKFCLPLGHHFVYFHSDVACCDLLPDGTDNYHSPGLPFERRLWVGGTINFAQPMNLFPKMKMMCKEKIIDVRITGEQNNEKIYVVTNRKIIDQHTRILDISEDRTVVFMRRKKSGVITERLNAQKPRMEPQYSVTVRPTRTLLFRFSALTYNAHRIHLDDVFCRQVEGLKSMIVQGPLTVVFMLAVLTEQLCERSRIISFSYRNLAPLYVEEDMKICVKKGAKTGGESLWHLWIEGPQGGYAVKGTATAMQVEDENDGTAISE